MASSKSFRASLMPSSLPLPSTLRSTSDPDVVRRHASPERPIHDRTHSWAPGSKLGSPVPSEVEVPASERLNDQLSPARAQIARTKTWSNRLSAIFPSLTIGNTDTSQTQTHKRKPVTLSKAQPAPTAASSLYQHPAVRSGGLNDYEFQGSDMPRSFVDPTADTNLPLSTDSSESIPSIPSSTTVGSPYTTETEAKRGTLKKAPRHTESQSHSAPQLPEIEFSEARKLTKPPQEAREARTQKPQRLSDSDKMPASSLHSDSAFAHSRGRSTSAQIPPPATTGTSTAPRNVSTPTMLRPEGQTSSSPSRGNKFRRSWLPGGGRSRSNSVDLMNSGNSSQAWVMTDDGKQFDYSPSFLLNAEKVPELWNENGNVLVHLYPRSSGCGPSFKIPQISINSSRVFNELIHNENGGSDGSQLSQGGRGSLSDDSLNSFQSPSFSGSQSETPELRLYLPIAPPSSTGQLSEPAHNSSAEMDRLIAIRNLFAFLTGHPLVGTKSHPSIFLALLQIAGLLQEFGFSSADGTSFGEAVDFSFGFFMESRALADCRGSREKTLEALVLGERMRSLDLYNEAFAHTVGKYSSIIELQLPLYDMVSGQTRQQLERAHLDLLNRQKSVTEHLDQFEFPSLFAGIANSTSRPEFKAVRFKIWRSSFNKMRQFVLNYYKGSFGSWPPKASSKKNHFSENGLNRLVVKALYSDMCALYDLLVDRNSLTSRVIDQVPAISGDANKIIISAIHNIMSEYDRSRPPVLPPIPYDLPQLPSPVSVLETYNTLSVKEQQRFDKKIKKHERLLIINKAYNADTNNVDLGFLNAYRNFEAKEADGKVPSDIMDQRIGNWLFLYAVLQSLPMLIVDAPGLTFTEGVEYFLCQPPTGNPPWIEGREVRKMWYQAAGGGVVELSTDTIMFSVEATYHRSHCWLAAKEWQGLGQENGAPALPAHEAFSPLHPPPGLFNDGDVVSSPTSTGSPGLLSPGSGTSQVTLRPRTMSPNDNRTNRAWRSSIALGLEPVPLDPPPAPRAMGSSSRSSSAGRPPSSHMGSRHASVGNLAAMAAEPKQDAPQPAVTSGATFDDILADTQQKPATKKKSKFF
jgi:hypothetical protein